MTADGVARGTSPPTGGLAATALADWLLAMEAAMRIGCSTRTIERLAAAKKLEARIRPQAGSPGVAVYNPDDVARIAAERRPAPAPFVLPAVTGSNGNGKVSHTAELTKSSFLNHPGDDPIRQLCAFVLHALQSPPSPPVAESVAEKGWLTIPEAAAVSGLSQAHLRRRCQSGWPGAIKDGAWKIRRRDLEAL